MTRTLRFCFDYISPYAYLAATQMRALAARHGVTVAAEPVLFAGLLEASGGRGPAEIPMRRAYLVHDVTRLSRWLGVPIAPPATHPFNPLAALRATHAVAVVDRWPLVDAIFRAAWVDSQRVDDPAVIAAIAASIGLDAGALGARAASDDIKAGLRRATADAVARGVFGVPTIIVDDQLFWGVDSLPHLERYLAGDDVPDPAALARWQGIAPSAVRRQP